MLHEREVRPVRSSRKVVLQWSQTEGRGEDGVRPRADDDGMRTRSEAVSQPAPRGDSPGQVPHRGQRVRIIANQSGPMYDSVRQLTAKGFLRAFEERRHVINFSREG